MHAQSQIDWLRYNDNFRALKEDSVKKKGTQKLKYIALASTVNISFGGELREQIQYYRNFNFGDMPSAPDCPDTWQLWHRAMAHANIEVGSKARIFTQLGSTFRFLNPNKAIAEIDENHLSLHQLFGEYHVTSKWLVRLGRQEMSYGSHRLITFREGPNTRLSFDAAVIKYATGKRNVDFIALSPVISRKGIFDDGTLKDYILGVYATEKLIPRTLNIDYYILNFESARRKYNYRQGTDSRRVVGLRTFSQNPLINYEAEATYQFGTFNDLKVKAYALFGDVNIVLFRKSKMLLGVAGNYVSGDRDKNDNTLNTYNPLFSKPQYGLTAPIGASNIVTFNPYLRINPIKRGGIYAGVYFMQRQSNQDGSYSPDGTELRPRPEKLATATGKQIGTLLSLETNYSVNSHWALAFDASYFWAGRFLEQTGMGRDITYVSFKAAYKF